MVKNTKGIGHELASKFTPAGKKLRKNGQACGKMIMADGIKGMLNETINNCGKCPNTPPNKPIM